MTKKSVSRLVSQYGAARRKLIEGAISKLPRPASEAELAQDPVVFFKLAVEALTGLKEMSPPAFGEAIKRIAELSPQMAGLMKEKPVVLASEREEAAR